MRNCQLPMPLNSPGKASVFGRNSLALRGKDRKFGEEEEGLLLSSRIQQVSSDPPEDDKGQVKIYGPLVIAKSSKTAICFP